MHLKPSLRRITQFRTYKTAPFLKMRLPYAPSTPPTTDPETTEIYNRIAARRHPRPIIPLDLALLNSPPVADGWNSFVGAIRTRISVDQGLLELAVSRVAVLTSAVYEWNAHAPLALKGGIKAEELQAVRTVPSTAAGDVEALEKSVLSDKQRAVVRYADEMTLNVKVRDETFELLRAQGFSDREVVEITTGIACYNCVSRVLVALDVNECNGTEMKSVEELVEGLK